MEQIVITRVLRKFIIDSKFKKIIEELRLKFPENWKNLETYHNNIHLDNISKFFFLYNLTENYEYRNKKIIKDKADTFYSVFFIGFRHYSYGFPHDNYADIKFKIKNVEQLILYIYISLVMDLMSLAEIIATRIIPYKLHGDILENDITFLKNPEYLGISPFILREVEMKEILKNEWKYFDSKTDSNVKPSLSAIRNAHRILSEPSVEVYLRTNSQSFKLFNMHQFFYDHPIFFKHNDKIEKQNIIFQDGVIVFDGDIKADIPLNFKQNFLKKYNIKDFLKLESQYLWENDLFSEELGKNSRISKIAEKVSELKSEVTAFHFTSKIRKKFKINLFRNDLEKLTTLFVKYAFKLTMIEKKALFVKDCMILFDFIRNGSNTIPVISTNDVNDLIQIVLFMKEFKNSVFKFSDVDLIKLIAEASQVKGLNLDSLRRKINRSKLCLTTKELENLQNLLVYMDKINRNN